MQKNIHFLFMLLAFVTITSITGCGPKDNTTPSTCSNGIKDGDETGVDCGGSCTACTVAQTRIKTIISISPINRLYDSLAYDTQNRQILTQGDTRLYEYIYKTDSVIKTYDEFRSGTSGTISYVLNSAGLAVSAIDRAQSGAIVYHKYTYDAQGYLLKETYMDAAGYYEDTTINTWVDGNLASRYHSRYNTNPGLLDAYNTSYTYHTDKVNSVGEEAQGILFLGKSSKNLLKSANDGVSGAYTPTYTFDANGRVTIEDTYILYSYY